MPFQGYGDGLYLAKTKSLQKGVDHYGILDIGNRLGLPNVYYGQDPIVVHLTPPRVRADHLTGHWEILEPVADEEVAMQRMRAALAKPEYHVFKNNCEQFARFVASGKHESFQLQWAVVLAGALAAGAYALASSTREGAA